MDWAAWGPTLVTIATALIIYGGSRQTQKDHGRRIDHLELRADGTDDEISKLKIEDERNKAWRDGYNAAKVRHSSVSGD